MQIAIILFYAILCSWALIALPFFKKAKINKPLLISIFYVKILVGIAYAVLMYKQQVNSGLPTDTFKYFNYSLTETNTLLTNPKQFVNTLFINQYGSNGYTTIWASTGSFWADFKNWFFVKILAVVNVATFNNYIANLIIINFLCFFGWVGLYKLLTQLLHIKSWLALLIVFAIPSTLFWNSGLHKDAFIYNSIGCLLWYIYKPSTTNIYKKYGVILFHIFIIFCFRYYTLLFVLVGLAGLLAYKKLQLKMLTILSIYFSLILILIIAAPYLPQSLSITQIFAQKQAEFLKVPASSDFAFTPIPTQAIPFITKIPKALGNVFATPNLYQLKGFSSCIAAVEIYSILLLMLYSIIVFFKNKMHNFLNPTQKEFILFCVLFVFTAAFTLGFINVNIGSIARYRSILLPFVTTAVVLVAFRKSGVSKH